MDIIKFKSFHDYTANHEDIRMFGCTCTETIFATKQAEEFLIENRISDLKIKDIKFSVDSKGNEHILLIYEVPEE
jgi:hypothetical protein